MTTELIIEAGHTERNYWRDLFRYRELFYFLAWRDVLVRYEQTVIGVLWAVIRPLLTMIVFHLCVRADRQTAVGRHPLPRHGFCRDVALAIVRDFAKRRQRKSYQ